MELVFARLGLGMDSMRLVLFVHEWAILEAKLGRRITVNEYAVEGPDSTATAYRRLDLFRRTFSEYSTPSDLVMWPQGLPLPAATRPDTAWRLITS
jgi:hypothetical protein